MANFKVIIMTALVFEIIKEGKNHNLIKIGGGNVVGYMIESHHDVGLEGFTTLSEAWNLFYEKELKSLK